MKLIHKTARYYLIFALFIFGLGTIIFYYVIKIILIDSIDEAIHQEKLQLIENLNYERVIDELRPSENISIRMTSMSVEVPDKYSTILVHDEVQNEDLDYRELTSYYKHNDRYYEIKLRQSMEEAEALLNGILPAEIGLFLIFMIGVLIMNNIVNRNTWQPFYDLLERMKRYDSEKTKVIRYEATGISEFNELGKGVEKMTEKIYKDYLSQKEFNENSSHELQTPLAILKNKLELLIQSPHLKEQEMELIQSMFDAIRRLSLLNKGLILISKIENRQFSETEKVNVHTIVSDLLQLMEEQIQERELETDISIAKSTVIETNPVLIEILISNLLSNSIKHNLNGGTLKIMLSTQQLIIQNNGKELSRPASSMFDRFKKDSTAENSVGLGLAIVKKICDMLNFEIEYTNKRDVHTMIISFFPIKEEPREEEDDV